MRLSISGVAFCCLIVSWLLWAAGSLVSLVQLRKAARQAVALKTEIAALRDRVHNQHCDLLDTAEACGTNSLPRMRDMRNVYAHVKDCGACQECFTSEGGFRMDDVCRNE